MYLFAVKREQQDSSSGVSTAKQGGNLSVAAMLKIGFSSRDQPFIALSVHWSRWALTRS